MNKCTKKQTDTFLKKKQSEIQKVNKIQIVADFSVPLLLMTDTTDKTVSTKIRKSRNK